MRYKLVKKEREGEPRWCVRAIGCWLCARGEFDRRGAVTGVELRKKKKMTRPAWSR
jgi:hypothetical protein